MNIIDTMFDEYNVSKYIDIELEVSLSCNFNCKYCCAHSQNFPREISDKHFEFIEKLYKYKKRTNLPFRIIIMGGEPLYQKNIKEFLDHLIKHNFNSLLFTNGVFIKKIKNYFSYFNFILSIHENEILKIENTYFKNLNEFIDKPNFLFNYLVNLKIQDTLKDTFYEKYLQNFNNVLIRPLTQLTYSKKELIHYKKIINEIKNPFTKKINLRIFNEFKRYYLNNFNFKYCKRNIFYIDSFGNLRFDCADEKQLGNIFEDFNLIQKTVDTYNLITYCSHPCSFTDTLTVKKGN